jgi:hypothetical protein
VKNIQTWQTNPYFFNTITTGVNKTWEFQYYPETECQSMGWKTKITDPRFQASAVMLMRSVLFGGITQHRMVNLYWHFGTMYWSHLQGSRGPWTSWALKMGPVCCSEMSVKVYHLMLRNTTAKHRSKHHWCPHRFACRSWRWRSCWSLFL